MSDLCAAIRETQKLYVDLERAEGNFARQIKAICRRVTCPQFGCDVHRKGGKHSSACVKATAETVRAVEKADPTDVHHLDALASCRVLASCLATIRAEKKSIEKPRNAMLERLPVWAWVESVRGLSHGSLARIVGGAGDIARFHSHVGLWKRFGLAMVVDSQGRRVRQRKCVDPTDAAIHGYSPHRRSDAFNIGEPLIRLNAHYKAVYDARRARTAETHPEWTKLHSHRDAHAIMTKQVFRDLWEAWRAASATDDFEPSSIPRHASADSPDAATGHRRTRTQSVVPPALRRTDERDAGADQTTCETPHGGALRTASTGGAEPTTASKPTREHALGATGPTKRGRVRQGESSTPRTEATDAPATAPTG